jgi:hypothetical protein
MSTFWKSYYIPDNQGVKESFEDDLVKLLNNYKELTDAIRTDETSNNN